MEIRNLGNTTLEVIVDCMNQSFQNYFVKVPSDVEFWANRYKAARVDYDLSFGIFDNEKLVAFIIHGIDIHNNKKTTFNTGTGVLEAYRGQQLVDQIYDFAFPILRENGIEKCLLEVIDQNKRAIKVYERIGFQKGKFLRCFNGELTEINTSEDAKEVDVLDLKSTIQKYQELYSWDNTIDTIIRGGSIFKCYNIISEKGTELGYFILNSKSNSLIQIDSYSRRDWWPILCAIKGIQPNIRINNVDDNRKSLINALKKAGLQNHVNQFEMTMFL